MLWKTIEKSTNAQDFKAYLTQYPNGAFAPLARSRMPSPPMQHEQETLYTHAAKIVQTQPAEGIRELSKAIEIGPDAQAAELIYLLRAFEYDKLHDYDHATADYSNAIRVKPDSETYCRRAFHYIRLRQFDLAQLDINQMFAFADSAPNQGYYRIRGLLAWKQQRFSLAIQDLTESIRLSGGWADDFCLRSSAKRSLGDTLGAISDANIAKQTSDDRREYLPWPGSCEVIIERKFSDLRQT